MRQTTGSMICPSCGKLISVNEERCPFCGAWRPSLYGLAPGLQRFFGQRFDLVTFITGACVVLYVASLLLDPSAIFQMNGGVMNLLAPSDVSLFRLGMTGSIAWQRNWWWTLFTAIYLHGSVIHILFNMVVMRNYLPLVDRFYGTARAFVIYTVAGVVGFLVSNLATGHPTIGASGSIFGLLGALIVYGRRTGQSAVTGQLIQLAVVMFILGFFMGSTNNWAHGGGFIGGWIASELVFLSRSREGTIDRLLALGCIVVTLVGVVLSFLSVQRMLIGG